MIVRIVRMTFKEESVEDFLKLFDEISFQIRRREGCHHLELMKDTNIPNAFITYSLWETEQHLESYRTSETFKAIWSECKKHFSERAIAFSMKRFLTVE